MPRPRHVLRAARRVPFEAWAWSAGLLALALADPTAPGLLDVCGWQWLGVPGLLGWEGCPGCGLGHAVAFLLDGQFAPALEAHLLAPFAVVVLVGRVAVLVGNAFRSTRAARAPF